MGRSVVFRPKKDESLRFCLDYRKLNALTVSSSYAIPRMDECIASLGDTLIFSTLDANRGFWQVEIDDADRDKQGFTSYHALFRLSIGLFGL